MEIGDQRSGKDAERGSPPIPDPRSPIPDPRSPIPDPRSPIPDLRSLLYNGNTGCCNSIWPSPATIFLNSARLTDT